MSLNVYLNVQRPVPVDSAPKIPLRENGRIQHISRDEWDRKFPRREPVFFVPDSATNQVFWGNITHNLTEMADAAGIYEALWHPEEIGAITADALISPLTDGLKALKDDPARFAEFAPENGWGTYETLISFVAEYRDACILYPEAKVRVSQ